MSLCPTPFQVPGRKRGPTFYSLNSVDPLGTHTSPRPEAATLPGNKCGNILRKLSVTIYNLRSAADNRGSVKTPCSLNTRAPGVKIKLNGILPLVNRRQAYNSHTHPLIGNSTGVCESHLQCTLSFTGPSPARNLRKTQRNTTEQEASVRGEFTSAQRKLLIKRTQWKRKKNSYII